MLHRIFVGVVTAILFCLVLAVSEYTPMTAASAKYLLFSFYNSNDNLSNILHPDIFVYWNSLHYLNRFYY
ncbi:hypothetical protein [Brevibacillus laterosporus]|uniref:hypothetical protein n=1 Tax=Brevibacillus laterosporus TaxID=1465 RepID=UPI003CEE31F0